MSRMKTADMTRATMLTRHDEELDPDYYLPTNLLDLADITNEQMERQLQQHLDQMEGEEALEAMDDLHFLQHLVDQGEDVESLEAAGVSIINPPEPVRRKPTPLEESKKIPADNEVVILVTSDGGGNSLFRVSTLLASQVNDMYEIGIRTLDGEAHLESLRKYFNGVKVYQDFKVAYEEAKKQIERNRVAGGIVVHRFNVKF